MNRTSQVRWWAAGAWAVLAAMLFLSAYGQTPGDGERGQAATQPADTTMAWLLDQATTAPTTGLDAVPATEPAALQSSNDARPDQRPGEVILSNGKAIRGLLSTTLRQPLRVWDAQDQNYQDIPFSLIASIQAQVVWERQEREWAFQQSGSDVKVYSGKTYPARMTRYVLRLKDGTSVSGGVAAPIYVDLGGKEQTFVLHKRDKGLDGQKLSDLVYVKTVKFSDSDR
jgi:hypothetical protein